MLQKQAIFAKKEKLFTRFIYRTPIIFQKAQKARKQKRSKVIQDDQELVQRTPRIFQEGQNTIKTGQIFQKNKIS